MPEWPLVLKTGFGNVFQSGRWDYQSTVLIAEAVNTGEWEYVIEFANDVRCDWTTAN